MGHFKFSTINPLFKETAFNSHPHPQLPSSHGDSPIWLDAPSSPVLVPGSLHRPFVVLRLRAGPSLQQTGVVRPLGPPLPTEAGQDAALLAALATAGHRVWDAAVDGDVVLLALLLAGKPLPVARRQQALLARLTVPAQKHTLGYCTMNCQTREH